MQYLVLLTSFFIFLFTLFAISRDDFVLFRRNVDMEKVFNIAFLASGIGLVFSRLFFVIFYFKPVYLHPLAFMLFPYFPGLSLPGGILGMGLALTFLLSDKKYPEGRLFDFFMLSGMVALLVGQSLFVGIVFVTTHTIVSTQIYQIIVGLILVFLAFRVFKKMNMKEGSIGLILIIFTSVIAISALVLHMPNDQMTFYKELIAWGILLLTSLVFYLRQESVFSLLKLVGKK